MLNLLTLLVVTAIKEKLSDYINYMYYLLEILIQCIHYFLISANILRSLTTL